VASSSTVPRGYPYRSSDVSSGRKRRKVTTRRGGIATFAEVLPVFWSSIDELYAAHSAAPSRACSKQRDSCCIVGQQAILRYYSQTHSPDFPLLRLPSARHSLKTSRKMEFCEVHYQRETEAMTDATANRLKEEGNKLMKENKANEAISKFVQSLCRCAALCLCRLVGVISAFDIVTSNQVH
jgi:hypothetical protein